MRIAAGETEGIVGAPPTNLRDQLRRDEGVRLMPYTDTAGNLTIGIGRNLTAKGINVYESEVLLDNDILEAAKALASALPWATGLDPVRMAVLENMTFNIGIRGLLSFHQTLALVRSGDYAGAAADMLQSEWAAQVGDRAKRLAEQMRTGEWN